MLPTSFSLRLYCGEPARAPSRISFALLLVLTFLALFPRAPLGRWLLTGSLRVILREPARTPHLVLFAVVLRTACSRSLAHFPRAPPGPHVPCALPSCSPRSMAPHWFSPCYTVRACSHSPSRSSIFTPLLAGSLEHPRVTHVHVRLIYILFACANLCLLLASCHSPSTCHFAIDSPHTSHALVIIVARPCDR